MICFSCLWWSWQYVMPEVINDTLAAGAGASM